jgi:hypothetical protein
MPLNRGQPAPSLRPPPQLARVCDHQAGRRRVGGRGLLLCQGIDEPDDGAAVDAAPSADDAVREHAKGLAGFAKEEDHAGFGRKIG